MRKKIFSLLMFLLIIQLATAQQKKKKREFYFSWGYNKEWYTRSNVKVNQPSLGNNYTLKNVIGHDNVGWDQGIFNVPLSIPQYNYRLGYFFNQEKGLAFEINFDHTKFIIQDGQSMRMVGTYKGRGVDSTVLFSKGTGSYYYLNNGANFLLFNIVKRWKWTESKNKKFRLDALAKAGIGPVIPHVENSFFGQANQDGFQLGGWNVGVEGALKLSFQNAVFLEFSNKVDYARYSGLKVYEGKASQAFGCYEMILSLGFTLGGKERK